mgnify:CR=1 FL=1
MMDTPLRKGQLVAVLDFESTGLDPESAEIVSVAVVHHRLLTGVEPQLVYKTLFRCPVPIRAPRYDRTRQGGCRPYRSTLASGPG